MLSTVAEQFWTSYTVYELLFTAIRPSMVYALDLKSQALTALFPSIAVNLIPHVFHIHIQEMMMDYQR